VKSAASRSERGTYLFFDTNIWDVVQVRFAGLCVFFMYLHAFFCRYMHLALFSAYLRPTIRSYKERCQPQRAPHIPLV
jgi:hypothetical protein